VEYANEILLVGKLMNTNDYDTVALILAFTTQVYFAVLLRFAIRNRNSVPIRKLPSLLVAAPVFIGCGAVVYVGYRMYSYDGLLMGTVWWSAAAGDLIGAIIFVSPLWQNALRPILIALILLANVIVALVRPEIRIILLAIAVSAAAVFGIIRSTRIYQQ
jgi:hypothetical protein